MDAATQNTLVQLMLFATALPLVTSLVVILGLSRVSTKASAWLTTGGMAVAFLCSLYAFILWPSWTDHESHPVVLWIYHWLPASYGGAALPVGVLIDGLTIAMMMMVTAVSTLVHVYSLGYMKGDKRFARFFAYLSLFSFSMLGIVISNSILQLFIFWELVGLTSYLLIGFWFEKRGPQLACKKAFVMNRIGDAGFLVGFGILFVQLGGNVLLPAAEGVVPVGHDAATVSMLGALMGSTESQGLGLSILQGPWWLTLAGIGLFCGAIGKSAQFPLHTWLPDAMEGPTPVSSIVHSATMVAAGVYLTARIYPILTPEAHLFIATIGLITLVLAATMALVMTDIKKVLAYSTLSQLGYMVLALGVGAWTFALYHLITHAFFKCCLFQCSGSVINACHHEQDMKNYGGLAKKMPYTAGAYLVCTLAIAGASIPFSHALFGEYIGVSGFFSKDGILAGAFNYSQAMAVLGSWAWLFYLGPMVIAYVTVFYMARSFALTFLGKPRQQAIHDHAHEAPSTMVIPQVVLAILALIATPMFMPFWEGLIEQGERVMHASMLALSGAGHEGAHAEHAVHAVSWVQSVHEVHTAAGWVDASLLMGASWIIVLAGGIFMYRGGFGIAARITAIPGIRQLHALALNRYFFDTLYDVVGVGITKIVAAASSLLDRGYVDGLVNMVGRCGIALAALAKAMDRYIVDATVHGISLGMFHLGDMLRGSQRGQLRNYIMSAFAAVVVLAVLATLSVYAWSR